MASVSSSTSYPCLQSSLSVAVPGSSTVHSSSDHLVAAVNVENIASSQLLGKNLGQKRTREEGDVSQRLKKAQKNEPVASALPRSLTLFTPPLYSTLMQEKTMLERRVTRLELELRIERRQLSEMQSKVREMTRNSVEELDRFVKAEIGRIMLERHLVDASREIIGLKSQLTELRSSGNRESGLYQGMRRFGDSIMARGTEIYRS